MFLRGEIKLRQTITIVVTKSYFLINDPINIGGYGDFIRNN